MSKSPVDEPSSISSSGGNESSGSRPASSPSFCSSCPSRPVNSCSRASSCSWFSEILFSRSASSRCRLANSSAAAASCSSLLSSIAIRSCSMSVRSLSIASRSSANSLSASSCSNCRWRSVASAAFFSSSLSFFSNTGSDLSHETSPSAAQAASAAKLMVFIGRIDGFAGA